jgi:hypothetical protein
MEKMDGAISVNSDACFLIRYMEAANTLSYHTYLLMPYIWHQNNDMNSRIEEESVNNN